MSSSDPLIRFLPVLIGLVIVFITVVNLTCVVHEFKQTMKSSLPSLLFSMAITAAINNLSIGTTTERENIPYFWNGLLIGSV